MIWWKFFFSFFFYVFPAFYKETLDTVLDKRCSKINNLLVCVDYHFPSVGLVLYILTWRQMSCHSNHSILNCTTSPGTFFFLIPKTQKSLQSRSTWCFSSFFWPLLRPSVSSFLSYLMNKIVLALTGQLATLCNRRNYKRCNVTCFLYSRIIRAKADSGALSLLSCPPPSFHPQHNKSGGSQWMKNRAAFVDVQYVVMLLCKSHSVRDPVGVGLTIYQY